MSTEVKIPALGESISSGVLSSWKVAEGTYVEIDQPIYELETDKITQEGLAEVAGVISFLAKEGDEVEIGATIANIDESAAQPTSSNPEQKEDAETEVEQEAPEPEVITTPTEETKAVAKEEKGEIVDSPKDDIPLSPAVRKILAESKLDPASISGTGKDGRITKADVLNAQKAKLGASAYLHQCRLNLNLFLLLFRLIPIAEVPVVLCRLFAGKLLLVWLRLSKPLQFYPLLTKWILPRLWHSVRGIRIHL